MTNKICAGIVTFNPEKERLLENLTALKKYVNKIYIVDNGSKNIGEIEIIQQKFSEISLYKLGENKGIAYALNKIIELAKEKYEWVLTLDQDSVIQEGLLEHYNKYLSYPNVGLISCMHKDRNYDRDREIAEEVDYDFVENCITSGCLTNIEKCLEVGGFENELFIDWVDYDLCYAMLC